MPLIIRDDSDALVQVLNYRDLVGETNLDIPNCCRPRLTVYGCIPGVRQCKAVLQRIPRSEWPRLIREGKGNWLSDIRGNKLPPHNQGRTPLCWAHGCARALEVLGLYQNQQPRLYSAEYIAYRATGGRMRGGSPDEALEILIKEGTCHQDMWPLNSFDVRQANPAYKTDSKNHTILDWLDIENFDDQMTCALNRIPVPIGLRWWGHLVCQLDPILFDDGTFGIGIDNSWGPDWGDNGYGILHESKGTADLGAFAPISQSFSQN